MKACVKMFLSLEVERDGGETKRESKRVSKEVGSLFIERKGIGFPSDPPFKWAEPIILSIVGDKVHVQQ